MVQHSRTIGLVAHDGANLLEISGPLQVFATATEQIAGMGLHRSAYRVDLVSISGGAMTTSVGLTLRTVAADVRGNRFNTLIVAGASPTPSPAEHQDLVAWIGGSALKRQRTGAVGNGCLLLAAAGLLEGRRVAARGGLCAQLYRDCAEIFVDPGEKVVCDGAIWTSVGASAALEMALAMIEADWGRRIALRVARRLSIDLEPPNERSSPFRAAHVGSATGRCTEPAL